MLKKFRSIPAARLHRHAGVTLIETMVTLSVAAIVLTLAVPAFSDWLNNASVRSSAEALQAALQNARAEAVLRNTSVRFSLNDSKGLPSWSIGCVQVSLQCPALIRQQLVNANTPVRIGIAASIPTGALVNALAAGSSLPAGVSFDALGAVSASGADIARIDITHASAATARRMVILIGSGGMIRLCDPASNTQTKCS